jgi:hypothetical protein
MFTWICPTCGREVPPAYTECPDCTQKAAEAPAAPPAGQPAAAPPPPRQAQPAHAPPPQQQAYYPPAQQAPPAPAAYYAPPTRRPGIPTWALTILFAFAIFGVVAGVYWLVGSSKSNKPTAAVESPAAKPGAPANAYQKYIEIGGVRFVEDAKKKTTQVRFVLVNHSNADILGLGGNVTVWGRTRNSEEDAAGTFTFTTDLKAYESKDMTVPLTTKLKIYELPDWQNVSTDVQITAPQ